MPEFNYFKKKTKRLEAIHRLKLASFLLILLPFYTNSTELDFSGFSTVAAGITDNEEVLIDDYDNNISFSRGSLFGLQVGADLAEDWRFSVQFVSQGVKDWDVRAEWVFFSYEASDELNFLVGRQQLPFFLYSDYNLVSFAYNWIEPPSFYADVNVFDGLSAYYASYIGDWSSDINFAFGRIQDKLILDGVETNPDIKDSVLLAWTLGNDYVSFRAMYSVTDGLVSIPQLQPLLDGWETAGFPDIANAIELNDTIEFSGLAATLDYNDFLITTEFIRKDNGESFRGMEETWYIMLGQRFDELTIHFTYEENKAEVLNTLDSVPQVPPLMPLIIPTQAFLKNFEKDGQSYLLGARWNISDSIAFKAEYKYIESKAHPEKDDSSLLQFALTSVF